MAAKEDDDGIQTVSTWKLLVAIGIVAMLVLGFVAFSNSRQREQQHQYNGFDFQQQGSLWVTRIEVAGQPYDIPFYYHPSEVEDVIVHENVTGPLLADTPQAAFISLDPDAGARVVIAGVEIARIMGDKYNMLNIPTRSALSREPETPVDVPIVHCDQATEDIVVIQFALDPEANAIVRDGNCIILFHRTPEDAVRVADRYAYELLRIM